MAEKLLRGRTPKVSGGVKQPSDLSTIDGPSYPERMGKVSTNPYNQGVDTKKKVGFVRG